jgi:hypothetical protein
MLCSNVATDASTLQVGDVIRFYDREGTSAGEFGVAMAGSNSQDSNAELFRSFCVQRGEYIDYDWRGFKIAGISNHSEANNRPLASETAYLYYSFINHSLQTPYDYAPQGPSHYNDTHRQHVLDANALQQAIWKFQGQLGGSLSGKAKTFYEEAYHAVRGDDPIWGGIGPVRILNLTWATSRGGHAAGSNAQDQLYMVPTPAAVWMGVVLLGGTLVVRRMRRAS